MDPLCQGAVGSLADPELIREMQRWQSPLQPCYAKRGCGLAGGENDGKATGREKSQTCLAEIFLHPCHRKNPSELLQTKTPLLRAGGARTSPAPSLLCQLTLLHATPFQSSRYSHGHPLSVPRCSGASRRISLPPLHLRCCTCKAEVTIPPS